MSTHSNAVDYNDILRLLDQCADELTLARTHLRNAEKTVQTAKEHLDGCVNWARSARTAHFGRIEHSDRFGVNSKIGVGEHRGGPGGLIRPLAPSPFVRLGLRSDTERSRWPIRAFIPDRSWCSRPTDPSVHVGPKPAPGPRSLWKAEARVIDMPRVFGQHPDSMGTWHLLGKATAAPRPGPRGRDSDAQAEPSTSPRPVLVERAATPRKTDFGQQAH